jgi:hypothetical protein
VINLIKGRDRHLEKSFDLHLPSILSGRWNDGITATP